MYSINVLDLKMCNFSVRLENVQLQCVRLENVQLQRVRLENVQLQNVYTYRLES